MNRFLYPVQAWRTAPLQAQPRVPDAPRRTNGLLSRSPVSDPNPVVCSLGSGPDSGLTANTQELLRPYLRALEASRGVGLMRKVQPAFADANAKPCREARSPHRRVIFIAINTSLLPELRQISALIGNHAFRVFQGFVRNEAVERLNRTLVTIFLNFGTSTLVLLWYADLHRYSGKVTTVFRISYLEGFCCRLSSGEPTR